MGWGLRKKNLNFGGSLKNPIFKNGMGGSWNNQYTGRDYLTRGTWAVCRFKRGLGKKEGSGFFEGVIPQCTHVAGIICFPPTSSGPYSCFKSLRKESQAPLTKKYIEKNLEVNIRWSIIYFVFISSQISSVIAMKPWFWIGQFYKWCIMTLFKFPVWLTVLLNDYLFGESRCL